MPSAEWGFTFNEIPAHRTPEEGQCREALYFSTLLGKQVKYSLLSAVILQQFFLVWEQHNPLWFWVIHVLGAELFWVISSYGLFESTRSEWKTFCMISSWNVDVKIIQSYLFDLVNKLYEHHLGRVEIIYQVMFWNNRQKWSLEGVCQIMSRKKFFRIWKW